MDQNPRMAIQPFDRLKSFSSFFWEVHKRIWPDLTAAWNAGRDPFNQNSRKFRSKTQWIGSVRPEKFRKNGSTFWGEPLFPVGPVGILVEWIVPAVISSQNLWVHEVFKVLDSVSLFSWHLRGKWIKWPRFFSWSMINKAIKSKQQKVSTFLKFNQMILKRFFNLLEFSIYEKWTWLFVVILL